MKSSEIKIGEIYRVNGNDYTFAKVIEILPPMVPPNNTNVTVVKCEWTVHRNDKFGLIKYLKASSLVKENEKR